MIDQPRTKSPSQHIQTKSIFKTVLFVCLLLFIFNKIQILACFPFWRGCPRIDYSFVSGEMFLLSTRQFQFLYFFLNISSQEGVHKWINRGVRYQHEPTNHLNYSSVIAEFQNIFAHRVISFQGVTEYKEKCDHQNHLQSSWSFSPILIFSFSFRSVLVFCLFPFSNDAYSQGSEENE